MLDTEATETAVRDADKDFARGLITRVEHATLTQNAESDWRDAIEAAHGVAHLSAEARDAIFVHSWNTAHSSGYSAVVQAHDGISAIVRLAIA